MHLNASNFYGGPEKQIVEHLIRLNPERYSCLLVSFLEGKGQNETLERAKAVGLRHYGISMSGPLDFSAYLRLVRFLRKEKIDLLCTHGYKSTVMGWWAGKKAQIPIIAFSRGYTTENRKVAIYECMERHVLNKLNGIICVSEAQKRRLNTYGISNTRTWVVHNAVSVNEPLGTRNNNSRKDVFKKLGLSNNKKLVVSAGRLSPEKGHRFLIEAISMLREKAYDTHFVICGEGACEQELKLQVQELNIAAFCSFVGFRRDLDEIFRVMDFMVLPSLTEGLPNVVLEAFANKKSVVATAVGGVPEIVEDGVNGILVPPSRPDLLAKGIQSFLGSKDFRENLGRAGYYKVKTDFSLEKQTKKLEDIYQFILN